MLAEAPRRRPSRLAIARQDARERAYGSRLRVTEWTHNSPRKARCWSEANRAWSLARWARFSAFRLSISATRAAKARWLSIGGSASGILRSFSCDMFFIHPLVPVASRPIKFRIVLLRKQ